LKETFQESKILRRKIKMRKLFLSFSGLINQLKEEKVSQEDLDQGIFYFGCTKGHVFGPYEETEAYSADDPDSGRLIHEQIKEAVQKAESENRAAYREYGKRNNIDQLNTLLTAQGYEALVPPAGVEYEKSLVKELIQASKQEIQVVY
jgi:hypothetical protein